MAYAIGLNSGSSFDGVDAVLIEINQAEDGSVLPPKYIDALSIDWPEDIQQQVLAAFDDTLGIFKLTRLNYVCGAVFAQAASELMKKHNLTGRDIRTWSTSRRMERMHRIASSDHVPAVPGKWSGRRTR